MGNAITTESNSEGVCKKRFIVLLLVFSRACQGKVVSIKGGAYKRMNQVHHLFFIRSTKKKFKLKV